MDAPAIGSTTVFLPRTHFHVLSKVDPADILRRWANGETLRAIAAEYQVTPAAVTMWLQRNTTPEDHAQARELHYETRLDAGLERIEAAGDDVNIARAREPYLRRLEWRAACELPHRFAPKPQTAIQVNGEGPLSINVVSYASHTQPQQSPPADAADRAITATKPDK